jgi:thiol-disulfide isomerase/thioredoxin
MPPKQQEIQFPVDSDVDFDKLLKNAEKQPVMHIIDLYAAWAGPCKPIVPTLRKFLSDNDSVSIHCLLIECEKLYDAAQTRIDRNASEKFPANWPKTFIKYKGRSMPTILFYVGGQLKEAVEGADLPALTRAFESALKEVKALQQQAS